MKNLLLLAGILLSAGLFANEKKVIYYSNGQKHFEYESRNRILNGSFIGYYENGKVKIEGQFVNNQKAGLWTAWDEQGRVRSQRKYEDNYSFELLKEWDSTGKAIDEETIRLKNKMLLQARSKPIVDKHTWYIQRSYKEISAHDKDNAFLFENNDHFFRFLIDQTGKNVLPVFTDDLLRAPAKRDNFVQDYRGVKVLHYKLKEDIIYTQNHQVMQTRVICLCPVVEVNGEKIESGWFYIPDIHIKRDATQSIEDIITRLEQGHYAGTIVKTTLKSNGAGVRDVAATESEELLLTPLDFEAGAWILYTHNYYYRPVNK